MKLLKTIILLIMICLSASIFVSCSSDDDDNPLETEENQFTSLESPYLICASRNPGGVGFDFVYNDETGGANNIDSLSVEDFNYDILIKTVKAEKSDGTLAGMPYIALSENATAVNYSAVDTTCKGITSFNALTSSLQNYTLKSDDDSFDVSSLTTGDTGKPLQSEVQTEYKKLVIGLKWKTSANNSIDEDELIWIIKTNEGSLVKMIVTDFPADPAPTTTGYVAITWEMLD